MHKLVILVGLLLVDYGFAAADGLQLPQMQPQPVNNVLLQEAVAKRADGEAAAPLLSAAPVAAGAEQVAAAVPLSAAAPVAGAAAQAEPALLSTTAATAAPVLQANQSSWRSYTVSKAWPSMQSSSRRFGQQDGLSQTLQLSLVDGKLNKDGLSFDNLTFQVIPETETWLHVKIHPTGVQRYEAPQDVLPRPGVARNLRRSSLTYQVTQPVDKPNHPFALTVARLPSLEPIFNTRGQQFVYTDKYIELTTAIPPNANFYTIQDASALAAAKAAALNGLAGLQLPQNSRVIVPWHRGSQLMSSASDPYPFLLQVNNDGQSHGVLLLNSNVTSITLSNKTLTYKLADGILDLYFFLGPSPEAVLRQYHKVIGGALKTHNASHNNTPTVTFTSHMATGATANETVRREDFTPQTPIADADLNIPTDNTSQMNDSLTSPATTAGIAVSSLEGITSQNLTGSQAAAAIVVNASVDVTDESSFSDSLQLYVSGSAFLADSKGSAVIRPLLFTNPADLRARDVPQQVMLGEAMLVSPVAAVAVATNGSNITYASQPYFTSGTWYSVNDYTALKITQGKRVRTQALSDTSSLLHIRGGSIIPFLTQQPVQQVNATMLTTMQHEAAQNVTLVVTLPPAPAPLRAMYGEVTAGPLQPYYLDAVCGKTHLRNRGKLVSCGFLQGGSGSAIGAAAASNNTLQVWYTAVTAVGARSGSIQSTVVPSSSPGKGKLKITAIDIVGVPGSESDQPAVSVYRGGGDVQAVYDATKGLIRITGLQLDAGSAVNVDWRLRRPL